jgi:hypothetical protein
VAAVDLESGRGYAQITVTVVNYTLGDYVFGGQIGCTSLESPVDVLLDDVQSDPIDLPVGDTCWVEDFTGGDPGELGRWGKWTVDTQVQIVADVVAQMTVTMEREYNGQEPRVDFDGWFPMEVFTVDRVFVNRTGGITVEGLAHCPALATSPAGPVPIISIDWNATQYIGRRTAIHGSYGSDIGKFCFDPEAEETPVRWTSMHPSGTGAATAWVYGVDGKFGSGTIIIEADALNDMSSVTQGWDPDLEGYDPACTTDVKANGGYDHNGDGFCAYSIWSGQQTQAALKSTSVKGR